MVLPNNPPQGRAEIERFVLEELPAAGPPPRGAAGLARARRFFGRAGNPQHAARQIHIVGTAGKGTAVGATVARLVGAGARVGAHLSPHVYDLRERFLFDGQLPSWDDVDAAMLELWPALPATAREEGHPPSFFELTTALAWTISRLAAADYVVTEAGIGGQYDATNAIDRPDKITVIMPIGYDHLEILGTDLESIARNKADVIPHGGLVIMAPQIHQTAAAVVRQVCLDREAQLVEVAAAPSWQGQAGLVADVIIERLDDPKLDLAASIAPVHLPGRMERVAVGGRQIILDGAHNPMKLRGVQEALDATQPTVLVAALSHEKQLEACAAELVGIADVIVASDFEVSAGDRVVRRSWSAVELARALKAARPEAEVHVVSSIERAVASALEITEDGDTIVATGSFMMIDPARSAARASAGAAHHRAVSGE